MTKGLLYALKTTWAPICHCPPHAHRHHDQINNFHLLNKGADEQTLSSPCLGAPECKLSLHCTGKRGDEADPRHWCILSGGSEDGRRALLCLFAKAHETQDVILRSCLDSKDDSAEWQHKLLRTSVSLCMHVSIANACPELIHRDEQAEFKGWRTCIIKCVDWCEPWAPNCHLSVACYTGPAQLELVVTVIPQMTCKPTIHQSAHSKEQRPITIIIGEPWWCKCSGGLIWCYTAAYTVLEKATKTSCYSLSFCHHSFSDHTTCSAA